MSEQMNEGAGLYCEECRIEGRNPVIEAFRAGRTVDKLYVPATLIFAFIIQKIVRKSQKKSTQTFALIFIILHHLQIAYFNAEAISCCMSMTACLAASAKPSAPNFSYFGCL